MHSPLPKPKGMSMKRRRRGQSVVEYLVLLALIIVALLVMYPLLIKSVNAMFKSYEDGIKDSFREEFPRNWN